jgi:hypothetical protein
VKQGDLVRVRRRDWTTWCGVEGRIGIVKRPPCPGRPSLAIVLIRGIPKLLELSDLEVISEAG